MPLLPEYLALVSDVETLEHQIADAQSVISGAAARKQAVMQRYLQGEPTKVATGM